MNLRRAIDKPADLRFLRAHFDMKRVLTITKLCAVCAADWMSGGQRHGRVSGNVEEIS